MGLFDFFSMTSIIVMVGTIFIIVSIYGFITYKMSEQDHKISSMIGIISSMAQEQEFLRNKLFAKSGESGEHVPVLDTKKNINLIEVSDDDDEEDEEDDDDDVSCGDSSSDNESDMDNESKSDREEGNDDNGSDENTQLLNIHLGNDKITIESSDIDIEELLDDEDDDTVISQSSDMTKAPTVKSIHLEQPISITENNLDNLTLDQNDNLSYLKILHFPESSIPEETDYKKMPVNKLRTIIIEKGILEDPSKLKKPELIKLIEEASL